MITRASTISLALLALGVVATPAAAAQPDTPISPQTPWLSYAVDERSTPLLEQWYGPEAAEAIRSSEPRWRGNVLLTGESLDQELLDALGLPPIAAEAYEPAPGVLYLNFDGVTLSPNCPPGIGSVHSAYDCSPLVSSTTTFAPWGTEQQRSSITQQVTNYVAPFDLVVIRNRPPEWIPYTMAVVGGSSSQTGHNGACGVANVQCDGLKRNHVSLNFAQSCPGSMADTIAQETAHNWGLEHTNNPTDLMYPTVNGGVKQYVNSCMTIVPNMDNPIQCGYVHDEYCGSGTQQNSHAELLGVFGPRTPDDQAPVIGTLTPESGATLTTADSVTISAQIDDNSRSIAVKWSWLEGPLPDGVDPPEKCTNGACAAEFETGASFDPGAFPWDFVKLQQPPVGTYTMQVETYDMYGNYATKTITFDVVEAPDDPTGGDTGSDDDGNDDSGGTGGDGDGDGPGDDDGGDDADGPGDATGGPGLDGGGGGSDGCRIASPRSMPMLPLLGLLAIGVRRRRR